MKMEVEFKSNVNTETGSMPYYDMAEQYGNEVLDMKVGNTDMKVRHIFKKFVEVRSHAHPLLVVQILRSSDSMSKTLPVFVSFRQQTTTWKHTVLTFLTS